MLLERYVTYGAKRCRRYSNHQILSVLGRKTAKLCFDLKFVWYEFDFEIDFFLDIFSRLIFAVKLAFHWLPFHWWQDFLWLAAASDLEKPVKTNNPFSVVCSLVKKVLL